MAVLLDLSRAFNSIGHNILLTNKKSYGFRGIALDWFRRYLKNRKQSVHHGSINYTITIIESDIPQGSVFLTLLFIRYTNDLRKLSAIILYNVYMD